MPGADFNLLRMIEKKKKKKKKSHCSSENKMGDSVTERATLCEQKIYFPCI